MCCPMPLLNIRPAQTVHDVLEVSQRIRGFFYDKALYK